MFIKIFFCVSRNYQNYTNQIKVSRVVLNQALTSFLGGSFEITLISLFKKNQLLSELSNQASEGFNEQIQIFKPQYL